MYPAEHVLLQSLKKNPTVLIQTNQKVFQNARVCLASSRIEKITGEPQRTCSSTVPKIKAQSQSAPICLASSPSAKSKRHPTQNMF